MGKRLYVGNLSFQTTEDGLRDAFASDGRQVAEVKIMLERDTGRSRGFAFVEMETEEDAASAVEALNGAEVDGRPLRVNEAQPRQDFGGGGGGGGGGYRGGGGGGGGYRGGGGGGGGGYRGGGGGGGYGGGRGGDRGGYGGGRGGDRGGYGGDRGGRRGGGGGGYGGDRGGRRGGGGGGYDDGGDEW